MHDGNRKEVHGTLDQVLLSHGWHLCVLRVALPTPRALQHLGHASEQQKDSLFGAIVRKCACALVEEWVVVRYYTCMQACCRALANVWCLPLQEAGTSRSIMFWWIRRTGPCSPPMWLRRI